MNGWCHFLQDQTFGVVFYNFFRLPKLSFILFDGSIAFCFFNVLTLCPNTTQATVLSFPVIGFCWLLELMAKPYILLYFVWLLEPCPDKVKASTVACFGVKSMEHLNICTEQCVSPSGRFQGYRMWFQTQTSIMRGRGMLQDFRHKTAIAGKTTKKLADISPSLKGAGICPLWRGQKGFVSCLGEVL